MEGWVRRILLLLILLTSGGFVEGSICFGSSESSPKPLIETLLGTYLLPGQGEILGQFRLPGDADLDGTSKPIRVFGRYKRFKKGSLEVIQVIWTQLGKEENNVLKKEKIQTRIMSILPHGEAFLEKSTPLLIKGNGEKFVEQVRCFAQSKEMGDDEKPQEKKGNGIDNSKPADLFHKRSHDEHSVKNDLRKNAGSLMTSATGQGGTVGLYPFAFDKKKSKDRAPKKELEVKREIEVKKEIEVRPAPEGPFVESQSQFVQTEAPQEIEGVSEAIPQTEEAPELADPLPSLQTEQRFPVRHHRWEVRNCEPLVDLIQGKVVLQKKKITFEDEQEIEEGVCEASQDQYPIKREYRDCQNLVDKEEGRVFRQYKRFWVDGDGQIHPLDRTCQKDEATSFVLREDPEGCAFVSDFESMKAQREFALTYQNHEGARIVVEGCRPNGVDLDIQKEFRGWRHDFEGQVSYKQYRFGLELQGVRYYLSSLLEEPQTYPHQKTTQTCSLFHDPHTGEAHIQERLYIETSEGPVWISPCRVSDKLKETGQGCEGLFEHDRTAEISRSYTRHYYERDGHRIYMTPCQVSTHTFPHLRRIVGYLHKDEEKTSYPKIETYLSLENGEEVILGSAQSDRSQDAVAYLLDHTLQKAMKEEQTFEGCFQLTPFAAVSLYKRADGSFFEEVGLGRTLKKSRDLCIRQEETRVLPFSSWELWDLGRNKPAPILTPLDPRGQVAGTLTCATLYAQHVPHKFPNMTIRITHKETIEKRTTTKFPDGQIKYGPWSHMSGPREVRTELCRL